MHFFLMCVCTYNIISMKIAQKFTCLFGKGRRLTYYDCACAYHWSVDIEMGSAGEVAGKVIFCLCGPVGSFCCFILSIWGIIMLVRM